MRVKSEYPTRHGDQHLPWGSDPIGDLGVTFAGYDWGNTAFATGSGPYGAGFDYEPILQWGQELLDVSDPEFPTMLTDGLYFWTIKYRLVTGTKPAGNYVGGIVHAYIDFYTVPGPLYAEASTTFSTQVINTGIYPQSGCSMVLPMKAGDIVSGGFTTNLPIDPLYPSVSGYHGQMDVNIQLIRLGGVYRG